MPTEETKPDLLSGTDVEKELAKKAAKAATEGEDTSSGATNVGMKRKSIKKSFAEFTNGKLKE